MKLPELEATDITRLELAIDAMNEELPPMRSFVLPGGHIIVSHCHVARCVCRRAERNVTHLAETAELNQLISQYLNRLSDYLFVLSRKLTKDLGATETPWKPRM
jgi:cob(I)alamin adenosyltransferase